MDLLETLKHLSTRSATLESAPLSVKAPVPITHASAPRPTSARRPAPRLVPVQKPCLLRAATQLIGQPSPVEVHTQWLELRSQLQFNCSLFELRFLQMNVTQ